MPDLTYILDEMQRRERGFAPHALLLYAVVHGMRPRSVLEFGAGLSTRVILDALDANEQGALTSIGTDPAEDVAAAHGFAGDNPRWRYFCGLSRDVLAGSALAPAALDLILHDGAHDAETVEHDLRESFYYLRQRGLLLIHDTLHSGCGAAVRAGVLAAMNNYDDGIDVITIPYGYGLTIISRRGGPHDPIDQTASDKRTSPHRTDTWPP